MTGPITVSAPLPFAPRLSGILPHGGDGEPLTIAVPVTVPGEPPGGAGETPAIALTSFVAADYVIDEARVRVQGKQATRLVRLLNRFLRWDRAYSAGTAVFEVTMAQLSPFRFVDGEGQAWGDPLVVEAARFERAAPVLNDAEFATRVASGFATGGEPNVADLALADARAAVAAGRFREAVLLCWSAIDATFTRRFAELVDDRLATEWGDARTFLKGMDFGLRQKMTTGMRLLTGRSFFDLPNNFWVRLSESYALRNRIIHRGDTATEEESRQSIAVAAELVAIVRSL